ncbi:MAG: Tryptophan-tRNA ligase [Patescibacteria group bacterium]|nr:Tryptophan-tRNA ligase [Patescibacteria group bacterium]
MAKKILLSGIQPTGAPHVGNYFGMMKQVIDLQNEYETYGMIVNYHALTTISNKTELEENTKNVVLDFLAIGADPEKMILFKQSDVPEHVELTWIFNCLVTMPWLSRAHAFKDKTDKGIEASVGLFDYPVLMAADILLYDTEVVPVGEDQRQHVEMAREIARKFNANYGDTFAEPKEMIKAEVAIVPGTDGQKMSKSYGNTIPLFGTDEEIQKAVMSIVTDSGTDIPANVYAIHKLFKTEADLAPIYEENKGKYKALKDALLADILAFVTPMRERREYYVNNPDLVAEILRKGSEKANAKASAKMQDVRKKVGLD